MSAGHICCMYDKMSSLNHYKTWVFLSDCLIFVLCDYPDYYFHNILISYYDNKSYMKLFMLLSQHWALNSTFNCLILPRQLVSVDWNKKLGLKFSFLLLRSDTFHFPTCKELFCPSLVQLMMPGYSLLFSLSDRATCMWCICASVLCFH